MSLRVGFLKCRFHILRQLPVELFDCELLVRAIFSPFHIDIKKGNLKPVAFDPSPGTDEISVMRATFLGASKCRRHAKAMENPESSKVLRGFTVLVVASLTEAGFSVEDSRRHFLGHADIHTGISLPAKGEPRDPDLLERSRTIGKKLIVISNYLEDPSPAAAKWRGPSLIAVKP